MPTSPGVTLTVTLQDVTGIDVDNGSLVIRLCGFGQSLPRIAGTSMLAKVTMKIPLATGISAGINLFGNDQITPAGTYYAIEVIDANKNIVQAGIYQFTSGQDIDLSNATQIVNQPSGGGGGGGGGSAGAGSYTVVAANGNVNLASTGAGVQVFDVTLNGDSQFNSAAGFARGTVCIVILRVPAGGPVTWAWGGPCPVGPEIPPAQADQAALTTIAVFVVDINGNWLGLSGGNAQ